MDEEKRAITGTSAWKGTPLAPETVAALEDAAHTLLQVGGTLAKSRLQEAADNLRTFGDQTEIIRVQTALDQKDLLRPGVDQKKLLTRQSLYRPAMPGRGLELLEVPGRVLDRRDRLLPVHAQARLSRERPGVGRRPGAIRVAQSVST